MGREWVVALPTSVLLSHLVLPYTDPTLSCLTVPALMTQRPELDPERPLILDSDLVPLLLSSSQQAPETGQAAADPKQTDPMESM